MIRRPYEHRYRIDENSPNCTSSFLSSSIQSNTVEGTNRHECASRTFHPSHFRFNIGRHSADSKTKNDHKRPDHGGFFKKQGDAHLLAGPLSVPTFRDLSSVGIQKSSYTVKKERGDENRPTIDKESSKAGEVTSMDMMPGDGLIFSHGDGMKISIDEKSPKMDGLNSIDLIFDDDRGNRLTCAHCDVNGSFINEESPKSDEVNSMVLMPDNDRDDRIVFTVKELEADLGILTNQRLKPFASSSSTNLKPSPVVSRFSANQKPSPVVSRSSATWGSVLLPSTTNSSKLLKKDVLPYPSSPINSTRSLFSWVEAETLDNPHAGKFSFEHPSISKDIKNVICTTNSGAREIEENEVVTQHPIRSVLNSRTFCHKPKPTTSITRHKHWTRKEDEILRTAMTIEMNSTFCWTKVSTKYFHSTRTATQCKNRWKNYLQPGVIRGKWTASEDKLILKMVSHGYKWKDISSRLPGRVSEHVRCRYVNYLDPTLKKSEWTKKEDQILFQNQRKLGNKWSAIRKLLPGRSENSIKNRYNNKKNAFLRKIKTEISASVKSVKEEARVDFPNPVKFEDCSHAVFVGI